MSWPEFALRYVFQILETFDETKESPLGISPGSHRADSTQPASRRGSRIADWARATGRCLGEEGLTEALHGYQVGSELDAIFRETPSFGRSLAKRLQDYHRPDTTGPYQLIGGGGEAVVFFDEERQDVVKLLSLSGKAMFGWEVDADLEGFRRIVPGSLATGLVRYARAEQMFPTGLEIDSVAEDGSFLLMRQPFFLGDNPRREELHRWMRDLGWVRYDPPTLNRILHELTWQKDGLIATDVRPENVIRSARDGEFYSIDFIMGIL